MPSDNDGALPTPPRVPTVKYSAPHGTRWDKEKAAAGGARAFDLPSDPKVLGPWIIGECVGKGASGRVKIAKHRYTNQLAAVKILPRAPLDSSRNSIATQEAKSKKHSLGIEREITMMKLMNHPNILRIYDVYEGPKELFLVLEYVEGGELFDYLVNRGRLPEPDAICFFKQIIYGLNYAHTFSIIHRDLKPENILISSLSPPKIKIVDWGMAAFAPPTLQLETSCGSPHYASPEIVNGFKYTGNATDIWSCGVILYALLTGRLPFDDKDVKLLLGKVKVGKYDMPSYIDRSAQDLLSKMLVINVEERITIPEILAHPWLNTSLAALQPVLPPSPSTLARPITDPSSIDSDILFSLKVIWGRHADLAAIVKDLGSPAGNGVYTKAFYWLLLRHHEEAERLSGSDETNDENTSATGMGPGSGGPRPQPPKRGHTYSHPRPDKPSAMTTRSNKSPDAISVSTVQFPPTPIHPVQYTQSHRSVSRSSRSRSVTTVDVTTEASRPHLQSRSRSHTSQVRAVSGVFEVPMEVDDSSMQIASTSPPLLPPHSLVYPLPLLTAPKTNDLALQTELDEVAEHMNRLSLQNAVAETTLCRDIQTQLREYHSHTHQSRAQNRRRTVSTVERGARCADKENKENAGINDESWSYVVPDEGLSIVSGKKNALFADTGNHKRGLGANDGKGKRDKEKKPRPPPLEFTPLNHKRSTTSALGSPIALSPSAMNSTSTKAGLGSPVVGEFKGWLSSLFSWSGKNTSGNHILYSIDDVTKTRRDLLHLLASLGVVVEVNLCEPGVERENSPLRCRTEESPSDALAHLGLKPVKFRIELTSIGDEGDSGTFPSSPVTPLSNGHHLFPTAGVPGVRGRSSTLGSVHGFLSALIVIQEKGSASTFKAIWKKLKDVYDDGCGDTINSNFSPVITSTPVIEPPRCVV
ncbi:Pkinase-domain-containing protein [Lentinula aff. lateritia]|uniref:Pkinase-domain-containing protein n=1 Tax=Lentinula aff. lateritia TaxID=2804960 RepID=A0ACC1U796_9AGAR|nr:Pkinase-domain-containing protein [Lentinula aff. lateritia]